MVEGAEVEITARLSLKLPAKELGRTDLRDLRRISFSYPEELDSDIGYTFKALLLALH